ncbi:hypothetical protein MHYP_G00145230 [Metynnis hypsauchen]
MKIILCLLLMKLSLFVCSVKSQSLESIPSDPVLVHPGGSFSVSCKAVGYDFGSYAMHWIRQPSGKALQCEKSKFGVHS